MRDDDARKLHINDCVRDSELDEIESLRSAAKPGEWYARNGRVTRHNGEAVDDELSVRFMARAWSAVGRLVRGIRVLEEALSLQKAINVGQRAEIERAEVRHQAEMERMRGAGNGPDDALRWVLRAIAMGAGEHAAVEAIKRWSRGADVSEEWLDVYRKRCAEHEHMIAALRSAGADVEAHIAQKLLFEDSGKSVRETYRAACEHLLHDPSKGETMPPPIQPRKLGQLGLAFGDGEGDHRGRPPC